MIRKIWEATDGLMSINEDTEEGTISICDEFCGAFRRAGARRAMKDITVTVNESMGNNLTALASLLNMPLNMPHVYNEVTVIQEARSRIALLLSTIQEVVTSKEIAMPIETDERLRALLELHGIEFCVCGALMTSETHNGRHTPVKVSFK